MSHVVKCKNIIHVNIHQMEFNFMKLLADDRFYIGMISNLAEQIENCKTCDNGICTMGCLK